jgi:hypothetical protein
VGDVDSLHVEIDNLNDPLVGFYFIRIIDFAKQLVGECNARLAGNYHFAVKSDSPFLAH